MTTKLIKTIATATTALLIGAVSLSAPAQAGGQFSLSFTPQNAEHQQVLGLGLLMLSLANGVSEGSANVRQNGSGNSAGVDQRGRNNTGLIIQDGNGHHGTIEQRGNDNNCALLQFGQATNARCTQLGNNQRGITTVFGF